MELSDLLMASIHGKDVWKCSYQEVGVQCVMMAGIAMMLQLCVDNWDSQLIVNDMYHMIAYTCGHYLIGIYIMFTVAVAVSQASFGHGSGQIVMDEVTCTGSELTLLQCTHTSSHDCNHNEDAGVRCLLSE